MTAGRISRVLVDESGVSPVDTITALSSMVIYYPKNEQ
jgi:hypothetical protein